ncbi:hypothetical protein A1O3_00232 [Capronia epimyces CBS 606.96]|uniref:Uncharacterized protein n=1 Tax=Capronia epimyces CBS 606.96 TaxID=1182542 RepID=W9YFL7_9EURO|nr:uncharacterized protein A1O3_00232 [Capronia epimyces CBS 606.96]EXJ91682.1 hypothetical protein A1O3_00232 [Capronia epimyces CBS 606.96]
MDFHQEQSYPPRQGQPFCRPFFLRIRNIEHTQDPQIPPPERGPDFYWAPPESRNQFRLKDTTSWWIWDPEEYPRAYNLQRLRPATPEENERRVTLRSCTMFWGPDRHGYLIVPVDCLKIELSSTTLPWRRLSFGRTRKPETAQVALAGYHMERYHLHIPGPEHWFEQLLPVVCEPPSLAPRTCTLAGDLSVLVGLIAFSADPSTAIRAVDQSFRPNPASTRFHPNQLPKYPQNLFRGMIIEIGYDPFVVTEAELRQWEDGRWGEIFS